MDLLHNMDGIFIEYETTLASIDIEALSSSIPYQMGLRAVEHFLSTRVVHCQEHNKFVMELLNFVLTRNYFIFNGRFYHQLRDTAMGNSFAPTSVNLVGRNHGLPR